MARAPSKVMTRVFNYILAFAGLAIWTRDANGSYTQTSADNSPRIIADPDVSSMSAVPVGSLLIDPTNGRLYVGNSSGTPKLVPQAGSNATYGDSVVLYFGDGNDIGVTWDGTRLVVSQAAADSDIRWGADGEGINHVFYGDTASVTMTWDQTNDQLLFADNAYLGIGSGAGAAADIRISWNGTKMLVAALTADSAIDFGVSGAGIDLVLYGDTATRDLTWDQSRDTLRFNDSAKLGIGTGAGAAADIEVYWDGTDLLITQLTANSAVKWGVDGAGLDQFWYGDTASAYLQWDQSADTLLFAGTAKLGVTNRSIGASTAAAGSVTGDAGVLPAGTAPVYPTTAADGTTGVRVNAADQVTGRQIFIGNGVSNQILKVYPPTGGTINGAAADAAFSSASGKGVIMVCLSSGSNTWLAW